MASHRKPRTSVLASPGGRRTAAGLTTAALASVTLLSQSAEAAPRAPKPTVEEVKQKVDDLYHQAEVATQKYNAVKERADEQRDTVDGLLDAAAQRAEKMNQSRRLLGTFASAQYRTGGMNPTAQLMLAKDPQQFVDRNHLMERLSGRQKQAVTDYQEQQAKAAKQRAEATRSLERLQTSQASLKESKRSVQDKLAEARQLLSRLTAQEKARLAELERQKEEAAKRRAAEEARKQQERERQRQQDGDGSSDDRTGGGSTGGDSAGDSASTKGEKALAFARAQIGKPYVWGATGPASYDCSGLTQAAWKAVGVDLPRTTWDQVKIGQRVATKDLQPGDLVFFYDDISHVGMYIGNGKMVHAPKPGANVREESIYYMPIYGSVRPG
ncbi:MULTISPECIES: C40 family peptidase [Streptomyces]|uniref:C40 family peptidase n=1 Tax=Streptomyces TaxID=1883 RepID=UPI0008238CDA|nr:MULTISPECIES: C40 family peptidase [Streptomyces]AWN29040.1 glycoside hydrolase [Streptomyces sp. NEAU-S7GS2]MCX5448661.1 NlpC/P60 family protein [Streptomyces libani]MYT11722.1 glycoside hydrolase [Streptomyces sp. SID4951]WDT57080.1 NlpC/P60 family protein [Streptomyces sp. G7(2002)]SCK11715.1 Cell wall-associated hydrolase, NlpC family [Streptomyces sp. SceaMP-e96]